MAFHRLLKSQPNSHLYFVGSFDFSRKFDNMVKKYADEHGFAEKVHFVGFDVNPYKWIKYSDCFVLPSRLEGLPNSLIEAMYLGCPVVATKCVPIINRIVNNGYNGFLVNSEDVDSMAEAMLKAPKLSNFKMTYLSASKEDFIKLFNDN